MSSYKKIIITFLLFMVPSLYADYQKVYKNEDLYILYAIEHEKNNDFDKARKLYEELFVETNKYEYLVKYLRISLGTKKYLDVKEKASQNLNTSAKEYETILRIYCVSLLNLKQTDEALVVAQRLIKEFNNALNNEVIANVYFVKKNFKKAAGYFEIAYSMDKKPNTLFNVVNIQYAYLGKKEAAVAYLETHIRLYGCDFLVCSKLLSIYQEQNNIEGVISILKRTYFAYEEALNEELSHKTLQLLIAYLEKKDINQAIEFLEEHQVEQLRLLSLYRRTNDSAKALTLARKLYMVDGNIDYLAQIAMLEFENARNKKRVVKSVIKKFEDVLTVLDSHVYQNYLGYILIDFDIDINRGLKLVNQALEKAPNNVAYLDSLAWGEYKLKNCKKAYDTMKIVVDEVGVTDLEIKKHWNKIKECKNR